MGLGEMMAKERTAVPSGDERSVVAFVARTIGVTEAAVRGWESGHFLPKPANLRRWMDVFGVEASRRPEFWDALSNSTAAQASDQVVADA